MGSKNILDTEILLLRQNSNIPIPIILQPDGVHF
jgi:hypothetical protein